MKIPGMENFVIVPLTGGFFRLLHTDSGLTVTDTATENGMYRFVKRFKRAVSKQKRIVTLLEEVPMVEWVKYNHGKAPNSVCDGVDTFLEGYRSAADGHVDKSVTANERYKYRPVFI